MELPKMTRFTDTNLRLSVEAPETWQGQKASAIELSLFAPDELDYSAQISFELKQVEPPTENWFAELIERTYLQGQIDLNQYHLVEAFEFVQAERPAFLARYEWVEEEFGLHFSQVDTLILTDSASFLEIHGFSLKQLEAAYIPIFVYIINSIRFTEANDDH